MTRRSLIALVSSLALLAPVEAARAWTRPAHMVTAAIAYDEIARLRPDLLEPLGGILDAHPDRGPFEVAVDRTTGDERRRRQFLECARWPDDARQTAQDRPAWHLAARPVSDPKAHEAGAALEALALNRRVLAEWRGTPAERALALCWVLHVTGDIHQPLHTAEQVNATFPEGDGAGGRQFVRDPLTGEPIALHWLWDDAVHRAGDVASVTARARELVAAHTRASFPELAAHPPGPGAFAVWAREESYPLAVSFAYGAGIPTSAKPAEAPAVPDAHWRELRKRAEARVTLAGYRIADVVIAALDEAAKR